jgi:NAD-dependent dihydropyrimidine dehydrogenase PreA subunit/flavodoxin
MIFYFSSTGNSKWAAETVAKTLGDRLIYIPDAIDSGSYEYALASQERLGFIFPVHGWRPSIIVRRFIKSLKINEYDASSTYSYMLVTAGDTIGRTTEIFRKDLRQRGINLDSAFSIQMPESYIGLPGFELDTTEREAQKIAQARKDMNEYIEYISERRRGLVRTVKGSSPWFYSGPVGSIFLHQIISDRKFRVDPDLCIKCGLCAKICPVHDIDGGPGKAPAWKHNGLCLSCFSCYHHCPKEAISYGKATQGKGQYFFGHKKT